ncbi:alpha/beta hydrolase [Flavobacterium kingsejongi]|uniref:Histidine kinase n=1 Tax=Flavobacterium kingsejongi TaxID=1678728 RepID=A0A2S1LM77_9FLAO|nr:alpha/beta hydrolase-fold protein [Flavobacterium kingsejongi]AWG24788.1 histidine kinase [Flavobacterium kingsejongi]
MKKITLLLLLCLTINAFSQKTTEQVQSEKLGETRDITIALPPSYTTNTDKKYPLLLILDGEYLFDPFNGALIYGTYWDDLPEVIVVGINQNKKGERFEDSAYDPESGVPYEKGAKFYEFIASELVPSLQKKYRIAPFKIIAGHDTTAGFLNFFLYKDQPVFNAYISLSPDLATDMEDRIPQRLSVIKEPLYYYHATADGDVKKFQKRIHALDDKAKVINKKELNYKFDDLKDNTHYSLVLHAIPNALYHIFSAYKPISPSEYQEKIATMSGNYSDYLVQKYDFIEKSFGIKMPIRMNDFKAIEAAILKNKAYPEFEKLAALSKKSYPKSMLADYQMGMYYENTGDFKKAARSYQSAFGKNEIGDLTKDMMLEKSDALKNK